MYLLTKETYNSKGKLTDSDAVGLFSSWDAVSNKMRTIAQSYSHRNCDVIPGRGNDVYISFNDGLQREFHFVAQQIEVEA